jgi:hypothetical protein
MFIPAAEVPAGFDTSLFLLPRDVAQALSAPARRPIRSSVSEISNHYSTDHGPSEACVLAQAGIVTQITKMVLQEP